MTSLSQKSINNSLTRANSSEIAGFAMSGNKSKAITAGASGADYQIDSNGLFVVDFHHPNNTNYLVVNLRVKNPDGVIVYGIVATRSLNNQTDSIYVPVHKGQIVNLEYSSFNVSLAFVYASGSESEAT